MATIILNGVETDTNPLSGASGDNDKLSVSGGLNGYEADMLAGNDLVEIDQEGESTSSTVIKGGENDDVLTVDSSAFGSVNSDITLSGGTGKDAIHVGFGDFETKDIETEPGQVTLTGKVNGNEGDDSIKVVRADDATVQGGAGEDDINLGHIRKLDVAGSRADTSVDNSEIGGGKGDDDITVEAAAKVNNSTISGGDGEDFLYIDGSVTGSSIVNSNADDDKIFIDESATLVNTTINGNENRDVIVYASGTDEDDYKDIEPLDSALDADDNAQIAEGVLIAGGSGHDHISVAAAGALTVNGGKGRDKLRVGSGQTVNGGGNADIFSIEFAGGAIVEDFNKKDGREDCYCSDVIQVDGNKIFYDTYEYKATKEKNTALSSYKGNIRVKAFEQPITDNCTINVGTAAQKTATKVATAVANYKVTKVNESWKEANGGNDNLSLLLPDVKNAVFPGTYKGRNNGNSPRPDNDVREIGFGYGQVTGIIADRGATEVNGLAAQYRDVLIPNLTVYTKTKFEKGDFSFLDERVDGTCKISVKQTLVFDDVTRGTITNHSVKFGFSKNTDAKSLYDLKFGTANFRKIRTGVANLVITNGLNQKTPQGGFPVYHPTPNQITNNALLQDGVVGNANQTDGGKWVYTRIAKKTATANAILDLSAQEFTLWTKINSGFGNIKGDIKIRPLEGNRLGKAFTYGEVTTNNGFVKYTGGSFGLDAQGNVVRVKAGNGIKWSSAQKAGLLTHTVATNILADVMPPYSKAMNKHELTITEGGKVGPQPVFRGFSGVWTDGDGDGLNLGARILGPENPLDPGKGIGGNATGGANGIIYRRQIYSGKNAAFTDTRTVNGSLIAKIRIDGDGDQRATVGLDSWLGRAIIKTPPQVFDPTDCNFDIPLTDDYIAGGLGGNQHNKWTPASVTINGEVQRSQKGKFGTKYLWDANSFGRGVNFNEIASFGSEFEGFEGLPFSNGCTTNSGKRNFSCTTQNGGGLSGTRRINAKTAILGRNGLGTQSGLYFEADRKGNRAFLSGSAFTTKVLAAAGMGDYAADAQGAPFRVLFFDNAGSDNGLYVMSGTANYKNGNVTAINTNTTAPSGMGGKHTIVNVIGGKGKDTFSLDDINFV